MSAAAGGKNGRRREFCWLTQAWRLLCITLELGRLCVNFAIISPAELAFVGSSIGEPASGLFLN